MPRRVDPQERRTLIADALFRVAAERGLEAVSLRHVAAEAGVTSGMVQHYFRSKDDMMMFALEVVRERVEARMSTVDGGRDAAATLRALLVQLLPLDEQRRAEGRVALAFLAYAAVHPGVADRLRDDLAARRGSLAQMVATAQDGGTVVERVDPDRAAVALLALVEGLGVHVLGGHYDADTALAVFDDQVALVLGST